MMLVRRLARALALAALFTPVAAAQTPSLTGKVVDPQQAVVVGAEVMLTTPGATRPRSVRSGADGTFTFGAVTPGRYTLHVASPGFSDWARDVEVTAGFQPMMITLDIQGVVEEIQVSGAAPFNLSRPVPTASRLGLSPMETPASVAVLSGDVIRSLGTPTLIVAKSLAPGITTSGPMGNGGNVVNARGFTGQNSVKQLFNGMEIYNAGNVTTFPFDPWSVDHIGVLYGPSSVLYGTGAIGGTVNVVTKRPDPSNRRREIELSAGRFNTYHAAVDVTGPLTSRVSYRVSASQRNTGHWVERGESNSVSVSGSVRFDATDSLRVIVSNDFGNQNPSKYLGTPVLNNAPVQGLRFVNYNVVDAKLNFRDNWTNNEIVWTPPSSQWSVHNNTFVVRTDRTYRDVPNYAFVESNNTVRRTQFRDIGDTYEVQYGDLGYVKYAGTLGGMKNDVLLGVDVNRNYYHRNDNVRGGTSIVNAVGFTPGAFLDFYNQESKPFYRIHVNQIAGYAEDHLAVHDHVSVVLGLRRDRYHINRHDELVPATTENNLDSLGLNAGTVVDVVKGLAVYAQLATASDPVNGLSSITASQQAFNLSPGRQVEAGLKQSLLDHRIEWTLAGYTLVKQDLLTPSLINPSLTEQVGQQSSKGMEASVSVSAGPVHVDVNGTILTAQFDDFKAVVSGRTVQLAGNVPLNVPERSANVLAFWDVTRTVQARGVLRVVGRRFSDNTNVAASVIPSYTVLDLGGRWRLTPRLGVDVRIDNVTDAVYADSGSSTQWLLGAPRSVSVTSNITF